MTGRPSSSAAAPRAVPTDGSERPAARRKKEGGRLRRRRASHSYGLVLGLVIGAFAFTSLAPDDRWAGSTLVLLLGATLVCALWTSGVARATSYHSMMLVAVTVAVALVNLIPGKNTQIAVGVSEAVLTIATGMVIARGVVDQGEINFQSVRGAIAIYILLGLLFTFLYGALAAAHSPLFSQGTDGTRSIRLYFSYVTLATLGYGDYSPANTVGHTLAIVEALVGQLYLVTIVALLVSRLHGPRDDDRPLIPPG